MKRTLALLLSLALLAGLLPGRAAAVDLNLNAKSALLMDVATGTVLYEKESHTRLAPASVTKVMTMLLIMEALDAGKIRLTDQVTASEAAAAKGGSQVYLKVGENMPVPEEIPDTVTVLQQPLDQIYLVSTGAMDHFIELNALDSIILSSQKADAWYLPEAKQAMEEGKIAYAGKYSAPDYETVLGSGCNLVIENAMIYHAPEVLEKLRSLGLPVLVELSSYESHPLGRMEWIKLYGALLNKEEEAAAYYDSMLAALEPVMNQEPTGKTVSFFYITTSGGINVRRPSDYVSCAIGLAGCENVSFSEDQADVGTSTMTIQMEAFYQGVQDADILIYNSIVDGELDSLSALLEKMPTLADTKAVKEGNVWCLSKNFYQETMSLGDFILDVNAVATGSDGQLRYLKHLQ